MRTFGCVRKSKDNDEHGAHYHDSQDYERYRVVALVISGIGLHGAIEHTHRRTHAIDHARVPVALLEPRHHLLHLNALRHGIGHDALDAVACREAHHVLIHDKDYEETIVAVLLAYAPSAEQVVREIEDVGIADGGQHHHRCLYACGHLKAHRHDVYAVARTL